MKKIIATLIIISLLGVPSFVQAEGGKEMPNYGSGWTQMKSPKAKKPASQNAIKNSIFMYDDKGRPASVNSQYVDKYKALGYTTRDDIDYSGTNGTPRITSSDSTIDYAAQLQALKNAQIKSRINALDSQRSGALSGLDAEQSGLSPMYYNKRNQAGARSDIGALNFAQFMASRGVQGNAGNLPEIYKNVGLQSQIGALDQQEASDNAGIEARRSGINSAYESDVAAAKADIEAQTMQAQIEQQRADATNLIRQQELAAASKTTADNTNYSRMQDTKQDYKNNIGQFAANFLAEYNKIKNDGDSSNDYQLAPLMAEHEQKKAEAQAKYQKQGYVSEDIAEALGLPVGTMTDAYKAKQESTDSKTSYERAWDKWTKNAPLTDEEWLVLGIPKGTQYTPPKNTTPVDGSGSNGSYGLKW
jgi:hypothetical protein